jgi:hypothetical protein
MRDQGHEKEDKFKGKTFNKKHEPQVNTDEHIKKEERSINNKTGFSENSVNLCLSVVNISLYFPGFWYFGLALNKR